LPDNDIKNGAVKLLRGIKWDRVMLKVVFACAE